MCAAQPDDFQQSAKKKKKIVVLARRSRRTQSEEQLEPLAEVSFSSVTMALTLAKMTTGVNLTPTSQLDEISGVLFFLLFPFSFLTSLPRTDVFGCY